MRIGVGSLAGVLLYTVLSCLVAPAAAGIAVGAGAVATSLSSSAARVFNSDVAADSGAAVQLGLKDSAVPLGLKDSDVPLGRKGDQQQNDTAILALEQLEATMQVLQDRVEARQAQMAVLREQRNQLAATVKSDKAAVKSVQEQLRAAQKAYGAARTKLERAKGVHESAAEAQRRAKAAAEQADADAAASEADVTRATSAQASATAAEGEISRKLVSLKYGSAAYRKAFTQWQNAAVAEQAANARAVLAEERASSSAVGRAAVQEELSEAGAWYSQAQEAATAAAVAFADRKVEVATLTAKSDAAAADLAKVSERARVAAEELAQLEQAQQGDKASIGRAGKQVAKLREQLAASGVVISPSASPASDAPANPGSEPATQGPSPEGRGNGDSAVSEIAGTASATPNAPVTPAASPALVAGQTTGAVASQPQSPEGTNLRLLTAVAALGAGATAAVFGLWLLRRPQQEPKVGD